MNLNFKYQNFFEFILSYSRKSTSLTGLPAQTLKCAIEQARSTDRHKLTANQRFRHSGLVTREDLGKMALGIVKYAYDRSSQLIGVIWFAVSLLAFSFSRSVVVDPNRTAAKHFSCFTALRNCAYYFINFYKLTFWLRRRRQVPAALHD